MSGCGCVSWGIRRSRGWEDRVVDDSDAVETTLIQTSISWLAISIIDRNPSRISAIDPPGFGTAGDRGPVTTRDRWKTCIP
jgi:hypothetical protein